MPKEISKCREASEIPLFQKGDYPTPRKESPPFEKGTAGGISGKAFQNRKFIQKWFFPFQRGPARIKGILITAKISGKGRAIGSTKR